MSILGKVDPEFPLHSMLLAVQQILDRGDTLEIWDWINSARYPSLLKKAKEKRRREVVKEMFGV